MKNFFSYFWQSISDFNFYKKVVTFKFSTAVKYFVTLLLICILLISVGLSLRVKPIFNSLADWAMGNLPSINIQDGKASVDARMPFVIKKGNVVVILDTTGETISIDDSIKQGVLLTANKLIYKQSDIQTNTYELAKIKNLTIDKATIVKWKKGFLKAFFPFICIMSLIYYPLAKIVQVLFFSLIPLMLNNIRNLKLKYVDILKISIFALTLPLAIAAIVEIVFFKVKLFAVLFTLIYAVYLVRGTMICVAKKGTEGTV
ncbi:MAG: DUF1189 domain-containing protein [Candidatus Omnitrophota bacterium]